MSRIEEALKKVSSQRQAPDSDASASASAKGLNLHARNQRPGPGNMDLLLDVVPLKIDHLMLVTADDENVTAVEEYNKLRSSVIALTKGETFLNTLMVTSTVSEEGKSMTALNLAISLAREYDHTVLLVDTDLRRPTIHKYLGIQPEFGLIQCLRDNLPIEKALVKTGIGKLVVLPAGGAVDDPVDLLSSNRMKNIIHELKNRYPERYVIFDTPPALPFADAGVLAAALDGTLFVVREGSAEKGDLHKTIEGIKEHNLLGIVYNDAHTLLKKQRYYY